MLEKANNLVHLIRGNTISDDQITPNKAYLKRINSEIKSGNLGVRLSANKDVDDFDTDIFLSSVLSEYDKIALLIEQHYKSVLDR